MNVRTFATTRVIDMVREDVRVVSAFAELGITPRYLYWTVASAAEDSGANLDRLAARLTALPPRSRDQGS